MIAPERGGIQDPRATREDYKMPMTQMTRIVNLELDHLDFAESCAFVECLNAALDAMAANWARDSTHMDRLALILAAAMRRKHAAFDERERERESFAEIESKRAEAEA